ncbi:MAG: hypothetical protein ABIF82_07735 [Planctomycetota bacterium]
MPERNILAPKVLRHGNGGALPRPVRGCRLRRGRRERELLPVEHFHTVFALPHALNVLALSNKKVVYDILFRAAAGSLSPTPTAARRYNERAMRAFTSRRPRL